MHQVSANYTMPTVLNSVVPAQKNGMARPASTRAHAAASSNSSTSSTSSTDLSTTFLTLLAQELQNQDPTAPVDPTEMVGQMISLNQLEQLISINQTITGSSTGTPSTDATQKSSADADAQTAATAAAGAVVPSANGSFANASSLAAATNQLPFDPNTMMPLSSGNAGAVAASMNSSINPTSMGFSGTNNNTTGGK